MHYVPTNDSWKPITYVPINILRQLPLPEAYEIEKKNKNLTKEILHFVDVEGVCVRYTMVPCVGKYILGEISAAKMYVCLCFIPCTMNQWPQTNSMIIHIFAQRILQITSDVSICNTNKLCSTKSYSNNYKWLKSIWNNSIVRKFKSVIKCCRFEFNFVSSTLECWFWFHVGRREFIMCQTTWSIRNFHHQRANICILQSADQSKSVLLLRLNYVWRKYLIETS